MANFENSTWRLSAMLNFENHYASIFSKIARDIDDIWYHFLDVCCFSYVIAL